MTVSTQVMLFVGVSTGSSSATHLFPSWARAVGIDAELVGVDLPVDAVAAQYRKVTSDLIRDPNQSGALVTTHKIGIFRSCSDLIDEWTPAARRLGEVGVLFKKGRENVNVLAADSNDFVAAERAAAELLGNTAGWLSGSREALIFGAGGSGTAIAHALTAQKYLGCKSVHILEVDDVRTGSLKSKVAEWQNPVSVTVERYEGVADEVVERLGSGSLIVNATGMGKDRPGSPVSPQVRFPADSIAWDFNYRFVTQSTPTFIQIALSQRDDHHLVVEDGWRYFLWGWTLAISRIFELSDVASAYQAIATASTERYRGFS